MSANEGAATKPRGKDGYATNVTAGRPRFHNHTQSSLLKRKEPVRPRRGRSSTSAGADLSQKLGRNVAPAGRLSGVSKKSRVTKQSKSMHALKTIIKREKDRQSSDSLRGDPEQTTSRHGRRIGSSLVFLQHDLINDISCDFKKYTGSSTGLIFLQDETPEFVDQLKERTEDMHASRLGDRTGNVPHNTQRCIASPLRNGHNFSKDRSVAEISHKLQQTNDDDDKNTPNEVKVLHHGAKCGGPDKKPQSVSSNEYRPIEKQIREKVRSADIHGMTKHTRTEQKTWINGKATGRSEEAVDVNRTNSRGNVKFVKYADRTRGKDIRSVMNSKTVSCQKNYDLQKKEHSSVERVGSFNRQSKNTSICPKQNKVLKKENRNPPVNRVAKICKQLTEAKQSERVLPNRRQSLTKVVCFPSSNLPKVNGSKISTKGNGKNSIRSRSRSKSRSSYLRQGRSITPKKLSRTRNNNNNNHCHVELIAICKRSSERSNVINALKEINAKYNVDIWEKNVDAYESKISVHEANDSETLRLNNDTSLKMSNDEIHLAKTKGLDRMDQLFCQSSCVSVGIQTDLNLSPFLRNDSERDLDLKKISRSSKTIGTQTSPRCNKNVIEIGCNATPSKSFCKDAAISCDLINWTNLRTNLTTIENDRSMTEDVPIHKIKFSSVEDENFHESKEFLTSECKEALNAETSSKSENYVSTKAILPNYNNNTAISSTEIDTIRDFTIDLTMENIIHEEKAFQNKIYLESSKHCNEWMNIADKPRKSTKCFKDREVNYDPINNLSSGSNDELLSVKPCPSLRSIYNYDVSCSSSSEVLVEYLENDAQYKEMIVTESKIENISRTLIAAFQLAAERARNLYEAVILYKENLMTRAFENQTSSEDQHCLQNKASFELCDNENEVRSECESECQFIVRKNEDFDVLSTCSSNSSDSDRTYEAKLQSSKVHQIDSEVGRAGMSAALPREEEATANLIPNERINLVLANVKSALRLLVRRMRERHASEILEVERLTESDDEDFRSESETSETSILPVIKEIKTISQQLFFLLVCCAVIILARWYLHFSFTFNCLP